MAKFTNRDSVVLSFAGLVVAVLGFLEYQRYQASKSIPQTATTKTRRGHSGGYSGGRNTPGWTGNAPID